MLYDAIIAVAVLDADVLFVQNDKDDDALRVEGQNISKLYL